MSLLDELCALAEKYKDAPEQQRIILKMAICLLDQLDDPEQTRPPRVRFTMEEYEKVPGRWELWDGQLHDY